MSNTLTRRAAFTALSAGTVAAALVPSVASNAAVPADRSAWTKALARYRHLDSIYRAANDVFGIAEAAYFERKRPEPCFTIETEGDYGKLGKLVIPVSITHKELDDPTRNWREPERIEEFRRTLAEHRAFDASLRQELRVDELDDAQHEAMERQCEALDALIATPAPDMTALAEKLAIILAEFSDEGGGVAAVIADVRRLGGEA